MTPQTIGSTGASLDRSQSHSLATLEQAPSNGLNRGRYEIGQELARGGMGVVYEARDSTLDRVVAVKVLQERFPVGSPGAGRFLAEARVTGRLQHPGVPPVHDLGVFLDGRPFLAMKLIRGRTLGSLLAARRDPADDLPRFMQVFEQVCQTVAYAHDNGVIHRDLKPANVMVGDFGEVQVMDWGLSKQLDLDRTDTTASEYVDVSGEAANPTPHSSLETTGHWSSTDRGEDQTREGDVLGTISYMAPEQAQGRVANQDRRTDVFGLGSILCEILIGHPPYQGKHEDRLQAAIAARLGEAYARLEVCGADPEVVSLARRCLAADRADRPSTAGEVAACLASYQAGVLDRLRTADLERTAGAVRALEQRRRRRIQRVLAFVVGLFVVGASLTAWWAVDRDRAEKADLVRRQDRTNLEVADALGGCSRHQEAGRRLFESPTRWRMELTSARASLQRGQAALESGIGSPEAEENLAITVTSLEKDERLCDLAERIDEFEAKTLNELRRGDRAGFISWADRTARALFTDVTGVEPNQYGAADLAKLVRGHLLRTRLKELLTVLKGVATGKAEQDPYKEVIRLLKEETDPILAKIRQAARRNSEDDLNRILKSDEAKDVSASLLVEIGESEQVHPGRIFSLVHEALRRNPELMSAHLLHITLREGPTFRNINDRTAVTQSDMEIVAAYAAAIMVRPNSPSLHAGLGYRLMNVAYWGWAAKSFREAMKLLPEEATYCISFAECASKANRPLEGLDAARRYFSLSPEPEPDFFQPRRVIAARCAILCGSGRAERSQSASEQKAHRAAALKWLMNEYDGRTNKMAASMQGVEKYRLAQPLIDLLNEAEFRPVREQSGLELLDPDDRSQWEEFWRKINALKVAADRTKQGL